ncbi:hypothetical protein EMCRGX_G014623 [Ephydatia muelleri]
MASKRVHSGSESILNYFSKKAKDSFSPANLTQMLVNAGSSIPTAIQSGHSEIALGQQEASTTCLLSPGTCYDIGDIASGKIPLAALTREHRVHYIKNHFVPGKQFQLSTYTLQRGDDRKVLSFQRAWLEQYKWLVYSSSQKADEVTDQYANKEILSVCLRYMNNDAIKEVLLDFVPLERANGAIIAEGIITSLQSNSIDISKCRGQGYDGASSIVDPNVYSDMNIDTNWEWDSETRIKAQGLLHSMKDPKILVAFIVTNNVLEIFKPIAVKLQKKDGYEDIVHAYNLIHSVISDIAIFRENIEKDFHDWFMDASRIDRKKQEKERKRKEAGAMCQDITRYTKKAKQVGVVGDDRLTGPVVAGRLDETTASTSDDIALA